MFKLKTDLPKGKIGLTNHLAALSKMKSDEQHKDVFNHLYNCLTILDDKFSALLTFNSIIIAVFALFIIDTDDLTALIFLLYTGISSVLISCFLLLLVVWVHWSKTEDFNNLDQHGLTLLMVRRQRTIIYRTAWYLSTFSVACLFLYLAIHIIQKIQMLHYL